MRIVRGARPSSDFLRWPRIFAYKVASAGQRREVARGQAKARPSSLVDFAGCAARPLDFDMKAKSPVIRAVSKWSSGILSASGSILGRPKYEIENGSASSIHSDNADLWTRTGG